MATMAIIYFEFRSEEEMTNIEHELKIRGYSLPNTEEIVTFDMVKEHYKKNKIFLIKVYKDSVHNILKYRFTTKQIENRKGIKNLRIVTI